MLGKKASIDSVFGSQNERSLASFKTVVKNVNALEEWAQGLNQEQIQAKVNEWRKGMDAAGAVTGRVALDEAPPVVQWVRRLAHRMCADHALAEDLGQEVSLALVAGRPEARGSRRAWLTGVLRNQSW